jgi:hypothetical protein
VKDEDAKDLKKTIIASMRAEYGQSNKVQALDCLIQDFPDHRDAESFKSVAEIIGSNKKTLSAALAALLLQP